MSGERNTLTLDWDRLAVAAHASRQEAGIGVALMEEGKTELCSFPAPLSTAQENGSHL